MPSRRSFGCKRGAICGALAGPKARDELRLGFSGKLVRDVMTMNPVPSMRGVSECAAACRGTLWARKHIARVMRCVCAYRVHSRREGFARVGGDVFRGRACARESPEVWFSCIQDLRASWSHPPRHPGHLVGIHPAIHPHTHPSIHLAICFSI